MNEATLEQLYKKLRMYHGSLVRISRESGYCREYVRMVLTGTRPPNFDIIETAVKVLSQYEKRRTKVFHQVAAII